MTNITNINGAITHFANPHKAKKNDPYPDSLKAILNKKDVPQVISDIKKWPNYKTTPLHSLENIAQTIGVNKIWYKDESKRFGLGSFKALGGAYAVAKQVINQLKLNNNIDLSVSELLSGKYKTQINQITISCATDGNHGRSVAWGAKLFGCKCIIYIHSLVSLGRERAIAEYGAKVIRINGNYDDSIKIAAADAEKYGYIIVSDTAYPGYMKIPKDVALGYVVMLDEIINQLNHEIPTHVFVQAGVGGLASTVCAYFWQYWEGKRPQIIIVEPENANCLQLSAIRNKPTVVNGSLDTIMAGLACGEVSILAWEILNIGVDDFITINDKSVPPTMILLAKDYQIEAGESAVPGLASLITISNDPLYMSKMNINAESKVLLFGTEGATDPELYKQLTNIEV